MPRPVVRGNPQVDQQIREAAADLAAAARDFTKQVRGSQKNLDAETVSRVAEQLHKVEAEMAASRAILEKLRRIRDQQSTALVGGGRRKR